MCWRNLGNHRHYDPVGRERHRLRHRAVLQSGKALLEIFVDTDIRNGVAGRDILHRDRGRQIHFTGDFSRRFLLQRSFHAVRQVLHDLAGPLFAEFIRQLRLYFVEGPLVCLLMIEHLKDVIAILGFDEAADFLGLQGKRRVLERLDGLPAGNPAEIPALGGRAWVLRIFSSQLREVAAGLEQLQQVFGLSLYLGIFLRRLARSLQKHVTDLNALGSAEPLPVGIVQAVQIRVRRINRLFELGLVQYHKLHALLLRNGKSVGILVVVFLDLGGCDLRFGLQLVGRNLHVLDFDFVVAAVIFPFDLGGTDHGTFYGDNPEPVDQHLPLHFGLEFRDGQILLCEERFVGFAADKFPVLKQLRYGPPDGVLRLFVGDRESQPRGLVNQAALGDDLVNDPRYVERYQVWRNGAAAHLSLNGELRLAHGDGVFPDLG